MKEKTFSDPLEPLSEDANRVMLGCCEELAKDASDAKWMMDDIVRRAEENIRLWNDNNKYARLIRKAYECKFGKPKEIDMKEKKTKKMTKAEAFEWLNGKKVNANGKGKEVQMKLFECGFSWMNGQCRYYGFSDYLLIETDGVLYHCGEVGDSYWRLHHFKEIGVDDILSIEIVDGEDNIAEKNAFLQARDIMKWLREKRSPHTLMIIDSNHVELLDGVKSEVWKE